MPPALFRTSSVAILSVALVATAIPGVLGSAPGVGGAGKAAFYCHPGPAGVEVAFAGFENPTGDQWTFEITVVNQAVQSVSCNFSGVGSTTTGTWTTFPESTYECITTDATASDQVPQYGLCLDTVPDPEFAPLVRFSVCAEAFWVLDGICGNGYALVARAPSIRPMMEPRLVSYS